MVGLGRVAWKSSGDYVRQEAGGGETKPEHRRGSRTCA